MDRFYRKKSEGATSTRNPELSLAQLYRGDYERGIIDLIKSEPDETSRPKGFQYNPKSFRRFYKD